ncbi:hypothetical protein CEUSTIGMA_g4310.t1 [Chlamydomonas eustigma]|uniref:RAP domain-containing protein n=1 Tax=Chlamydomonas eustigma TaxID=1157962 RepID=A0A250X187_9CHLO|nr:hypothetical protein CEUSTIGMA_g4310.t1 [Chlamydomonas eustigma]|eukprot:GAX76864.1 hypothetical protein CEUSTIGMA_g4310.t1 [Chlamydomonas eustigma]
MYLIKPVSSVTLVHKKILLSHLKSQPSTPASTQTRRPVISRVRTFTATNPRTSSSTCRLHPSLITSRISACVSLQALVVLINEHERQLNETHIVAIATRTAKLYSDRIQRHKSPPCHQPKSNFSNARDIALEILDRLSVTLYASSPPLLRSMQGHSLCNLLWALGCVGYDPGSQNRRRFPTKKGASVAGKRGSKKMHGGGSIGSPAVMVNQDSLSCCVLHELLLQHSTLSKLGQCSNRNLLTGALWGAAKLWSGVGVRAAPPALKPPSASPLIVALTPGQAADRGGQELMTIQTVAEALSILIEAASKKLKEASLKEISAATWAVTEILTWAPSTSIASAACNAQKQQQVSSSHTQSCTAIQAAVTAFSRSLSGVVSTSSSQMDGWVLSTAAHYLRCLGYRDLPALSAIFDRTLQLCGQNEFTPEILVKSRGTSSEVSGMSQPPPIVPQGLPLTEVGSLNVSEEDGQVHLSSQTPQQQQQQLLLLRHTSMIASALAQLRYPKVQQLLRSLGRSELELRAPPAKCSTSRLRHALASRSPEGKPVSPLTGEAAEMTCGDKDIALRGHGDGCVDTAGRSGHGDGCVDTAGRSGHGDGCVDTAVAGVRETWMLEVVTRELIRSEVDLLICEAATPAAGSEEGDELTTLVHKWAEGEATSSQGVRAGRPIVRGLSEMRPLDLVQAFQYLLLAADGGLLQPIASSVVLSGGCGGQPDALFGNDGYRALAQKLSQGSEALGEYLFNRACLRCREAWLAGGKLSDHSVVTPVGNTGISANRTSWNLGADSTIITPDATARRVMAMNELPILSHPDSLQALKPVSTATPKALPTEDDGPSSLQMDVYRILKNLNWSGLSSCSFSNDIIESQSSGLDGACQRSKPHSSLSDSSCGNALSSIGHDENVQAMGATSPGLSMSQGTSSSCCTVLSSALKDSSSDYMPGHVLGDADVIFEHVTEDGLFSIDIALLFSSSKRLAELDIARHSRGSSQQLDDSHRFRGIQPLKGIAVEVDGPTHYCLSNDPSKKEEEAKYFASSLEATCSQSSHPLTVSNCVLSVTGQEAVSSPHHAERLLVGASLLRNQYLSHRGWKVMSLPWWEWDELGRNDDAKLQYLTNCLAKALQNK